MSYLTEYKNYLQRLSSIRSNGTIDTYLGNVQHFITWFEESYGIEFTRLNSANIKEYISYLKNEKKRANTTINNKLSAILIFNYFLIHTGVQKEVVITKEDYYPLHNQKINPTKTQKYEITMFRQKCLDSTSINRKRNYAMMTLMATTGIRAEELVSIETKDIDLSKSELKISSSKTNNPRIVYLPHITLEAINDYLIVKNNPDGTYKRSLAVDDPHLFVSRQLSKKNGHYGLCRQTLNRITKSYRGETQITPHELRHHWVTWAVKPAAEGGGGLTLEEAAALAGHNSIRTTSIYTNPIASKMKAKVSRYKDSDV